MTKAIDLFNDFATNDQKVTGGVWCPYAGDVEFLIAKHLNKNFSKVVQPLYKRNQRLIESNTEAGDAKVREITIEAMAKTVLLGWKGPVVFQGQSLDYSVENAKKLLALEGFYKWVEAQSKEEALYKQVQDEEDEKN